jgi:hypothetical protein
LKYGFHALVVFYGRFFLAATGLELLTIAVAAEEIFRPAVPGRGWLLARALSLGSAFSLVLVFLAPRLLAYVQSRDIDLQQHTYRFYLEPPDQRAGLDCVVEQGVLAGHTPGLDAMIRTLQPDDPAPGDKAVAECVLTGSGEPRPLTLQVLKPLAPGGLKGHVAQRVELDGQEIFYHDIGQEPQSGWVNIPLGNVGDGIKKRVVIEVKAINPEPGAGWAYNSRTSFQLSRTSSVMHLAMGRPTAQSSTFSGTTGPGAAVDGQTDGSLFGGSVTSTNRDTNAWWQVDLGASKAIGSIVIWNRTDCCGSRLGDYWVFLSDIPFSPSDTPATLQKRAGTWKSHQTLVPNPSTSIRTDGAKGRYVRVQLSGTDYLSLAEVQVFGQ